MYPEYKVIDDFEKSVAAYAGAPYAIAVDTGSSAIFLACKFLQVDKVILPKYTFIGVPTMVKHAGGSVEFADVEWDGEYKLDPYNIVDSCCRFRSEMYRPGEIRCLSFQYWHHLNVGRGGMILTDREDVRDWCSKARFWGREQKPITEAPPEFLGYQLFMEPERAARGLSLMQRVKASYPDMKGEYTDLSTFSHLFE